MTQKKRRIDPGQEKAKEDRRRKRLTKALKKMDKKERQPKPLSECEVGLILSEEGKVDDDFRCLWPFKKRPSFGRERLRSGKRKARRGSPR